jgi:hypothetical protein
VGVHPVLLAKAGSFAEFTRDPLLSMAAILLIVVSVAWIFVSRLIVGEMKRAAIKAQRRAGRPPPPPRRKTEVWKQPPS